MKMRNKKPFIVICTVLIITAAVPAAVFLNRMMATIIGPYIFLPDYSKPVSKIINDTETGIIIEQISRRIEVYSDNELIWRLPYNVKAQDFIFADVDHDGENELLVLCWKRGRYGKKRPTWVKHDEIKWSQHIFIYEVTDNTVRPKWMASDIGMNVSTWYFSDGVLCIEDTDGIITEWVWRTWGLEKL
ncbi:MAG: hypothetical protein IJ821_01480 [Lachnospiraceae bacterium]|nr:hypothetical protein [Lachnospiraceae bacterium]